MAERDQLHDLLRPRIGTPDGDRREAHRADARFLLLCAVADGKRPDTGIRGDGDSGTFPYADGYLDGFADAYAWANGRPVGLIDLT